MNTAEKESKLPASPSKEEEQEEAAVKKFSALRESIKQRLASPNPTGSRDLLYPYTSEGSFGNSLRQAFDRKINEVKA